MLSRALGFEFRSHDLRRTAATRMGAAGVPSEHISRVLNHIVGGPTSTRIYNLHDYTNEKRTALEAWERELKRVVSDTSAGSVLVFAKPNTSRGHRQ